MDVGIAALGLSALGIGLNFIIWKTSNYVKLYNCYLELLKENATLRQETAVLKTRLDNEIELLDKLETKIEKIIGLL